MKIFQAKESVLDRVEQAFPIFLKNFFSLVIPYFLFQAAFIVFIGTFFFYFIISGIVGIFSSELVNFSNFYYSPKFIYFLVLIFIFFIVFLLLQIPLVLGTIKGVRQALLQQKVTPKENIIWGFYNIFSSFKTYWYIFAYVFLIPACVFIVGGVLFNLAHFVPNLADFMSIGIFLMIASLLLLLFFSIYRGTKATFPIFSAIDKESFTKDNFKESIKITNNNWWRILGNFLLIGLIIGLLQGFIAGFLDAIFPDSVDYSNISYNGEFEPSQLVELLQSFNPIIQILRGLVDQVIAVSATIFVFIFTYIFMLRLQDESQNDQNLEIQNLSTDEVL